LRCGLRTELASISRAGVDVVLGCQIDSCEANDDGVTVRLTDSTQYTADLAVVGVGVLPNTELARDAGLEVDNGIVTDAVGRTSDAAIFACGDVTAHDNVYLGRRVRLESWAHAQNQAIATAHALLGEEAIYAEVPWFWSDQYDMNLQLLGMPSSWGESVTRGDPIADAFSMFYLNEGRLQAAISVNNPRDIKVAKRLMERDIAIDPKRLADPATKLQTLLKG
jgi:3-phenylpropionate/trans-cinnamate dioxygenase ferredoxin reductase component